MSDNTFNKFLNYLYTFEDSISFKTERYFGFKVRGKVYAQVADKDDYISVLIKRKYISDDEISSLNISLSNFGVWKQYAELRIPIDGDATSYKNVVFNAYNETKKDYETKIQFIIEDALLNNESVIAEYISNPEYIHKVFIDYIDMINSYDISYDDLIFIKSDLRLYPKYNYVNLIKCYSHDNIKYDFVSLIYNLIVYIYKNILNIDNIENLEDSKLIELDIIKDHMIVESIINYKLYKDTSLVSSFYKNIITYITDPYEHIPIFDEILLYKFIKAINPDLKIELDYATMCHFIINYLGFLNISVNNLENKTALYGKLLSCEAIKLYFFKTNSYWKLQPFLESGLSYEEVQDNLDNNFILSRDKALLYSSSTHNIFYVVKNEMPLFLGFFTGEAELVYDDLYKRKYTLISSNARSKEVIPMNKLWGNKKSLKSVILVHWNEIEAFEQIILMNLFGYDSEALTTKISELIEFPVPNKQVYIKDIINETDIAKNIIFSGPSKSGKSYRAMAYSIGIIENLNFDDLTETMSENSSILVSRYNKYISQNRIKCISAHNNYNYSDFVCNITDIAITKKIGIFLEMIYRAEVNPSLNFVLFIENINRMNILNVFGEMLMLLSERNRSVTLPSKEIIYIPNNLFLIGTSTYYKSDLIDTYSQLNYIFKFIAATPNYSLIPDFSEILRNLNKALYAKLKNTNLLIGQGYFMDKSVDDIGEIINHNIIPLLSSYFPKDNNVIIEIFADANIEVAINDETFLLEFKEYTEFK